MGRVEQTNKTLVSDIGRRLDDLPVGPMHRRVVVAIGLGLFFEIYEIFLSSTISTTLKTQYGLDGTTLKLLLASSFLGMFIGAATLGGLADRIGRRRAFLFNLIWFSAWSLIGAFSPGAVVPRHHAVPGRSSASVPNIRSPTHISPTCCPRRTAADWPRGPTPVRSSRCRCSASCPSGCAEAQRLRHRRLAHPAGTRVASGPASLMLMRRGLPESPRWLARRRAAATKRGLRSVQFETGAARASPPAHEAVARDPSSPPRSNPFGAVDLAVPRAPGHARGLSRLSVVRSTTASAPSPPWCSSAGGYDVTTSLLYTALSFLGYPIGSVLADPPAEVVRTQVSGDGDDRRAWPPSACCSPPSRTPS